HNFQFVFQWSHTYYSYIYKVNQGINTILSSPTVSFTAPFQVVAYNTPTTQKNYFRDTSFYLQDTWNLKRRLTLNLGVRYDRFTTYYRAQKTDPNLTFPQLFQVTSFPASGNLVAWNTVSPRIGVAFDPTGKGDSVLRFAYGIYYIMQGTDRKSTRLNSSHRTISYAVFCLKKKKTTQHKSTSISNTMPRQTR